MWVSMMVEVLLDQESVEYLCFVCFCCYFGGVFGVLILWIGDLVVLVRFE